ncbi:MAG: efflux RND transporter periplasmic adaptor subunit [Gemmatimonadota bacterium]|nr:efflux RND transporter periplasmic adaptor subunit [Gemmatimonadota bacterium]
MRKNKSFALASLVPLAAAALVACGSKDKAASTADSEAMAIGPENIAIASNGTLTTGPALSGTLLPEREASIRSQITGSVTQTYVEQGSSVGAGAVLARIDASGITDAYNSARSGVTSARSAADLATRDLARNQRLLAAGAIAERDIEQSRRASIAANAALEEAKSRLASAERQVRNTVITAPFGGIVSERPVSAGDVVQAGTAVVTVVDPSSMRLEASVPTEQLASIRPGIPVSFTVSGYPGRQFVGHVTRINPTVDPATRQVRIYVSIPNAGRALVGGLFATGRLGSDVRTGLVIPVAALDTRGATATVMRIKGGCVQRVDVVTGLRDEGAETIEIKSGLAAGDTLLRGAAQGITPGTAVKVSAINDKPLPKSGG